MDDIKFSGLTCITRNFKLERLNCETSFKYLILHSGHENSYYSRGNFLHDKKHAEDFHLFLVIKKGSSCFQDVVIKEALELSKEFKYELHLSPGQMNFENKPTLAIRFRPNEINHIDKIVKALSEKDIKFVKDKKTAPFTTTAFYKRYIEYKQIKDGVFQDNTVDSRYFIKMPESLSYDEFQEMMQGVKNTCKFKMFDYFLAQLYHQNKIIDFAGVYSNNCQLDMLEEFKGEILTHIIHK